MNRNLQSISYRVSWIRAREFFLLGFVTQTFISNFEKQLYVTLRQENIQTFISLLPHSFVKRKLTNLDIINQRHCCSWYLMETEALLFYVHPCWFWREQRHNNSTLHPFSCEGISRQSLPT